MIFGTQRICSRQKNSYVEYGETERLLAWVIDNIVGTK